MICDNFLISPYKNLMLYSLELPRQGYSNENPQQIPLTFEKNHNYSILIALHFIAFYWSYCPQFTFYLAEGW